MPRANLNPAQIQRATVQRVAQTERETAGKLVYTAPTVWEVRKGGAFRDNPGQMHDHCASILASGKFSGAGFSSGDDYIAKCAAKTKGPSNQPWWKFVTINHHITHVLDDLSRSGAAP